MDDQGNVVRWYGTITDIEDRKRAEDSLRSSEQNFRRIVNSIPGYVCALTASGEIEFVNNQVLEYFGKTLDELKNWAVSDTVHPDDLPEVIATLKTSIETGQPTDVEVRLRRADGIYRWFLLRRLPQLDSHGQVVRWYTVHTDIEDRKQAQQRLQNENIALREEVDHASMFEEIVGSSAALRGVLSQVAKVAPTESTVLILGETGTGKELIARAIHNRSNRPTGAFVRVNCA